MKSNQRRAERRSKLWVTNSGEVAGTTSTRHRDGFSVYYFTPTSPKKAQHILVRLPGQQAQFQLTMKQASSLGLVLNDIAIAKNKAKAKLAKLKTKLTPVLS